MSLTKGYYIFQLITSEKKKPFSIKVSTNFLKIFIIIILTLIVTIGIFTYIYLPKAINYDKLMGENEKLIKDRLKIIKILSDYNRIKQIDHYIRSVLGADLALSGPDTSYMSETDENFDAKLLENKSLEISFLDNMPITPPVDGGYITQGFVTDNLFEEDNHYGIDIAAPEGAPVKAAASGIVIFSNWSYHYGNMIIIYHQGGYFSIYGHNSRNIVREHQMVERGEVIAFVGNTGESEGPHLHFEIWKDGMPIDPQKIIYAYKDKNISFSSMEVK